MQAGAGYSGATGPQSRSPPRSVRGPLRARARVAPGPPALAGPPGRLCRHHRRREIPPAGSNSSSSRGSSRSRRESGNSSNRFSPELRLLRGHGNSSSSRSRPGLRLLRSCRSGSNSRSGGRAFEDAGYPALLGYCYSALFPCAGALLFAEGFSALLQGLLVPAFLLPSPARRLVPRRPRPRRRQQRRRRVRDPQV